MRAQGTQARAGKEIVDEMTLKGLKRAGKGAEGKGHCHSAGDLLGDMFYQKVHERVY
jgi:hypothetical protein